MCLLPNRGLLLRKFQLVFLLVFFVVFITPTDARSSELRWKTELLELIHWDFDRDTDAPRIPEGSKVQGRFYSVGVKRGTYATGSPGKAASASQWMTAAGSAWIIRISTTGYEQLRLNAKQYSSATGPSAFLLQYSLDSLSWKPLAEIGVTSSFAFNFASEGLVLPAEVNHHENVWIRWQVKTAVAVNGNAISSAGTSRIDEISIKGYAYVEGLAELPQTPASDLTLSNRTDSSLSLQWRPGSGYRRLVVGLRDSLQRCTPSHQVSYDPGSENPDRRTLPGGCPVLYNGSAQQFLHTSLSPLTHYGYAIIEYNGLPGREHYRWQDAPSLFVKTRARPPQAPDAPTLVELTGEEVLLRPPNTAPAALRMVFSAQRPTYDQLLSLEQDRYVRFDTTGLFRVVTQDTLIRISRSARSLLPLWYWSVSGPPGDRSPQAKAPDAILIDWPHLQPSGQLAQWSFDEEQLLPLTRYSDFESSALEAHGAVISGFTTGFTGKAVSLNQWAIGNQGTSGNQGPSGNQPKAWSIRIPSLGLDRLRLNLRMIASASGPYRFRFECRIPTMHANQGGLYPNLGYQGGIYEAAADWKSSRLHHIELPEACMNRENVQLVLVLVDPQTRNGQPISNAGTLRIDELSLEGSYRADALPVPLPPQITRLDDGGVWWSARLGSTAGRTLGQRYVELFKAQLPSDPPSLETLIQTHPLPLMPHVSTGHFPSLTPARPHMLRHCVTLDGAPVCSPKTVFTTPFAIPPKADPYGLTIHENDSISLHIAAQADQLWMVWTQPDDPMPMATDSLTVFCSPGSPCVTLDTLSTGTPYGRGRLQPGKSYRLWTLASNGPLGRQRYARPPHATLEVRIPPLPPPDQSISELKVTEQTFDQLHLRWHTPKPQPVLVLACPDSLMPAQPLNDQRYPFHPRVPLAGRLNAHTYVLYDGDATELRIHELPLQATWSVLVIPYHARHGAVSYAWEQRTRLQVRTFPDPRKNTLTARQALKVPLDSAFHTLGGVLWQDATSVILHTRDGNLRFEHAPGRWNLRKGDSLAVRAMRHAEAVKIQYLLKTGTSRTLVKPYVATSADTNRSLETHAMLALGNVLRPIPSDEPQGSSGVRVWQRGAPRRSIIATGPSTVLAKLLASLPEAGESALLGIPLVQASPLSGNSPTDVSPNALRLWIPDAEHLLPYTALTTPMQAPNLQQLFSWSSQTDDTLHFSWRPYALVRPYDQFPDSVQRQWELRIRNRPLPALSHISTRSSTTTRAYSARALFTMLAPPDSMGAELEWSLLPYLISHHHVVLTLPATPWQSFFVYRLRLTGTDPDTDVNTDLPTHWGLGPAYPNPFNPVTRFEVIAPRREPLSLRIYDSLGRCVQVLYEGTLAVGKHPFAWNARALPSGVYFIRLISPSASLTRSVTVMR